MSERVPDSAPSSNSVENQHRKRDERIRALREFGIDAQAADLNGVRIGAVGLDRIIKALKGSMWSRKRRCKGCPNCVTMSCCGCRHGLPHGHPDTHHVCDPNGPCDGTGWLQGAPALGRRG